MASRTAFPGTATNTTHLASEDNSLPGGWIGYVEITSSQGSISTETDITGLSVTVTVNTTRRIKLTAYCSGWLSTVNGDRAVMYIKESTTKLQEARSSTTAAGVATDAIIVQAVLAPSSGSHTYKVSFERNAGTGSLTFGAGTTNPAFLLVEDVGPSS